MDGYRKFPEIHSAHNAFRYELQYYPQCYFNSTLRCFWCCSCHIDFLWNWLLLMSVFLPQDQGRVLVCNQIIKSVFRLCFFIPSKMTRTVISLWLQTVFSKLIHLCLFLWSFQFTKKKQTFHLFWIDWSLYWRKLIWTTKWFSTWIHHKMELKK